MSISIKEVLYVAADRNRQFGAPAYRTRRPSAPSVSFNEIFSSLQNAPDYKTQAATPDVQVYPGTLSWLAARQFANAEHNSDDE
ncbi:hypothetical protein FACS18949_05000 [Clostridia bacterium]|nr:hypothetical protein FACS189425_03880 [Clostridia bacterium]GHV32818.1 hypothetical protein FACS18949_05000 [Clostridia bacterium]